jgi:hypothetical protein
MNEKSLRLLSETFFGLKTGDSVLLCWFAAVLTYPADHHTPAEDLEFTAFCGFGQRKCVERTVVKINDTSALYAVKVMMGFKVGIESPYT